MKRLLFSVFVVLFGSLMGIAEVEAKRMGGGRSSGIQRTPITQSAREAAPPRAPTAAPAQQARPQTAPAPQQSGWRRFMGPLAGLAAGIGLASLLSHFGIGGDFAGVLLALLAAGVAFMLIRRFMGGSRRAPSQGNLGYASAGAPYAAREATPVQSAPGGFPGGVMGGAAAAAPVRNIPAGFDVEGFVRGAKVNFIRLQAAYDAGDLADIREFTSPEMFAEIKLDIDARGNALNKTEVLNLDADLLDVSEEGSRYLASVRFYGLLREDGANTNFDEVWHLSKPREGNRGWTLAGIEQV
ncbi:Tim44-like domain-containing protein [Niveibacterium sp. SC-1]|uniref:Tim44 domain-containing protein n=1 Tax=Niveibacterium sp. SC-1 TaxID=3135646 RepID=UPI00311D865D